MTTLGYSRKNPHPHDGRHAGKSHKSGGVGGNGSGNPDGRGALYLKIHPRGVTFNFIDVLIALIDKFAKNCDALSNFIILSNYGPLTTFILSFHP